MSNQRTGERMGTGKHLIRIMIGLVLVFAGSIVLMQFLSNAEADTIIVAKDGNGDYENIQDAIDAAVDGDTILVYEGTYFENVVVNKRLDLIGSGPANTTIDGGGSGSTVSIQRYANISDFRITGAEVSSAEAGIKIQAWYVNITNVNCSGNGNWGIHLGTSMRYLSVVGCVLQDNGVGIYGGVNSVIRDNVLRNHTGASIVSRGSDTIIGNNSCSESREGIIVYQPRTTLLNNTVRDMKYEGIKIHSDHNIISNNILINTSNGFLITGADNNTLSGNSISVRYIGMDIDDSTGLILYDNHMTNSGLRFEGDDPEHWNTHTIATNNTVNGKGVYYFSNKTNINVPEYAAGQIIIANCTDVLVSNQNCSDCNAGVFIVFSKNITFSNVTSSRNHNHWGFYVAYCGNITLTNCTSLDGYRAVYMRNTNGILIENCNFSTKKYGDEGMVIYSSSQVSVIGNRIWNTSKGIRLFRVDESFISRNWFSENSKGIVLDESDKAMIMNNTSPGSSNGISTENNDEHSDEHTIYGNAMGISLLYSDRNNVTHNTGSISLSGSRDNVISYNNCSNKSYGITVESSSERNIISFNVCNNNSGSAIKISAKNNIVKNNICNDNRNGIYVIYDYNSIENNICNRNEWRGIEINNVDHIIVRNNTCEGNDHAGIFINYGSENTIEDNRVEWNGEFGILLKKTIRNIVLNNTLVDEGITIEGESLAFWNTHTMDSTNTINGRVLFYLCNETGGSIPGNPGQVILANCKGINLTGLKCSNGTYGIMLAHSSDSNISEVITSGNVEDGIFVYKSSNIRIWNVTGWNNGHDGIYLYGSSNCEITDNSCFYNGLDGIGISDGDENIIAYNNCSWNRYDGLYFYGRENRAYNNSCWYNGDDGIHISSASDNSIENNTFYSNGGDGIYLTRSSRNLISNNSCALNEENGIGLHQQCSSNELLNNICDQNIISGILMENACTKNNLQNNFITRNQYGIMLTLASKENEAHNNSIFGNTEFGIDCSDNDNNSINANMNWWGSVSGPFHPDNNPQGVGDNASDNVDFSPWIGGLSAHIESITPNPALIHHEATFVGSASGGEEITRYVWESDVDGILYDGPDPTFTTTFASPGKRMISFFVQEEGGGQSPIKSKDINITEQPIASIQKLSPNPAQDEDIIIFESNATDDGMILLYSWVSDIDGEIFNGTSWRINRNNLSIAEHVITHRVMDNFGFWSAPITVHLTVTPQPYSVISIHPFPAVYNASTLFTGTLVYGDNATKFKWTSSIDGKFYDGPLSQFTYSNLSLGVHEISILIKDSRGYWPEEEKFVLIVHERPVIGNSSISSHVINFGDNVDFQGSGTDDGNVTRYIWHSSIDGELFNGTVPNFSTTSLTPGNHTITFEVIDDYGTRSEGITDFINVIQIDSTPPELEITSHADLDEVEGEITISGTSDDDMIVETVEYRFNSRGQWILAEGSTSWSVIFNTTLHPDGDYLFEFRSFDGIHYSTISTITLRFSNEDNTNNNGNGNGNGNGDGNGNDEDESDDFFLFQKIWIMPLIAYLAILLVIIMIGFSSIRRKDGKPQ